MAQKSRHSIHHLSGDFQYDNPDFMVVIVSNGYRHYTPTKFCQSKALVNWRLSLIGRHLTAAMDIFNVIKDDMLDKKLISCFVELRININDCKQMLGSVQKGTAATIPDLHLGSSVPTSASRVFHQDFEPAPLIRRNLSLDSGLPTTSSVSSTSCPVKSAGQKAPPQKAVSVVIDKFFPVVPTTEVVFKEFDIPIDFSGIKVPAQPVTTAKPVTTTTVVSIPIGLLVSTSDPSTASSVTGSSTATISTSSTSTSTSTSTTTTTSVTTVLGTVVSSVQYRRFNCQKCSYKTDRRQDFENHQRIHERVKIKCRHRGCRKTFWTQKSKKAHYKTVHMKIKRAKCHHLVVIMRQMTMDV